IHAGGVPGSKCDACIHIREVPHHSEPEQSEANQSANVCDLSEWLHKRANSMTEFCEAQENFSVIKIQYYNSYKSPACSCVSITLPAPSNTRMTASCERLEDFA